MIVLQRPSLPTPAVATTSLLSCRFAGGWNINRRYRLYKVYMYTSSWLASLYRRVSRVHSLDRRHVTAVTQASVARGDSPVTGLQISGCLFDLGHVSFQPLRPSSLFRSNLRKNENARKRILKYCFNKNENGNDNLAAVVMNSWRTYDV